MNKFGEKSYERYKQYRLNKYRYGQEQIWIPVCAILIGAVLISVWQYILLAIGIAVLSTATYFLLRRHALKQMNSVQPLLLSTQEARSGVEICVIVKNAATQEINVRIPPNTRDGQEFVARNVKILTPTGERKRVDIHFKASVKD